MARQLGSAIGVAVLVALLADPLPSELFDHLLRGLWFSAFTGLGTAALGMALGSSAQPSSVAETEISTLPANA